MKLPRELVWIVPAGVLLAVMALYKNLKDEVLNRTPKPSIEQSTKQTPVEELPPIELPPTDEELAARQGPIPEPTRPALMPTPTQNFNPAPSQETVAAARTKLREAAALPPITGPERERAIRFGADLYQAELTREQTLALRAISNAQLQALVVAAEKFADSPDQTNFVRHLFEQFAANPKYWAKEIQTNLNKLSPTDFPIAKAAGEELLLVLNEKIKSTPATKRR